MNTPKNLLIANPDQSIVLTPAEVIRRMFAYTDENGILIVPQWPCDDCVEQGYYICRMKRKGTQRNRGIILGYFSNLAVEVCPADRPDDSYPSAERQLLQRLEDLRERVHGNL